MASDNPPEGMETATTIDSRKDFAKNAKGLQKRWTTELDAAETEIKRFWRRSDEIVSKLEIGRAHV